MCSEEKVEKMLPINMVDMLAECSETENENNNN